MSKAKPFIKWVGGKSQLIEQLEALLPADFSERENVRYIEPFVGGGAMLFYMLTHYPNIKRAIINDVNEDLINCYLLIKNANVHIPMAFYQFLIKTFLHNLLSYILFHLLFLQLSLLPNLKV